ncbi:hypothetical protein EWB00_007781 [Schistosoma japonicum]|uniref:Uncharacterized protein n=1 Tax=Schistosoma japonicum TaxID=6182 RepID=A0A4Z2CSW4_SCHJA|nr:hypothetical protein EWB00_007781 [Schistosoma japonicum]
MSNHYMLALICFFVFASIQYIDATDENFVKTQSPMKRHMMKRSYLWDVRLGKRSMNPEAFPWYNYDHYNHYKDDNSRGYYTIYDD